MKRRKKNEMVQLDLFGIPIESSRSRGTSSVLALDFNSKPVRMIMIKGEPWWVASDICRVLKIGNTSLAVNGRPGRPSEGLDDDEKGIATVNTLKGDQEMLVVNLFGVFQLILKSRKPDAKHFKRWLTHEVIPEIQRTGSYSIKPKSRAEKEAKRLKCDPATAKIRCDQFTTNRSIREDMLAEGGCVNDIVNYHEAGYQGEFGKSAAELRQWVGAKHWQTPLDFFGLLALSINLNAKAIVSKMVEAAEAGGVVVTPAMHAAWLKDVAAKVRNDSLSHLYGAEFQVVYDRRRGAIIDVMARASLN